jgi:tetratricopeptide (TPR) repeat protein
MGETGARSNLAADLAHSMALGGRPDEARRYAEESRALAAREDVYAQVRWRAAAARALAAAGDGDHDRAVRLAREAVALAEATDMLNLQADALVDLAETAARSGRPEEAAEAAGRSLPLYERKGNQVAAASARVRLGLAAPPQAGGSAG